MDEKQWMVDRFEEHRGRLRAVAYRMLGSFSDADDALQEAWLRVSRAGMDEVENLGGWLTTIVARVCPNMLRSRSVRREDPFGIHLPDPLVSRQGDLQPEEEAVPADSVGLALLVVLDSLTPAERLAFVLHDMFKWSTPSTGRHGLATSIPWSPSSIPRSCCGRTTAPGVRPR